MVHFDTPEGAARAVGGWEGGLLQRLDRGSPIFKFGLKILNQTYYNNLGLSIPKPKL
jgi:hypothetical protein